MSGYVRPSVLGCHLQANRVGHLVCGSCHITLMYAHGAQSVKCAVCQHVTEVTSSNMFRHGNLGAEARTLSSNSLSQTVVIENPPSLDEHGNQVIALFDSKDTALPCEVQLGNEQVFPCILSISISEYFKLPVHGFCLIPFAATQFQDITLWMVWFPLPSIPYLPTWLMFRKVEYVWDHLEAGVTFGGLHGAGAKYCGGSSVNRGHQKTAEHEGCTFVALS